MNQGTVITFYSYKGGVGRTFVMANVAVVLARWGYRVLCVDWDLEAPGLWHYFEPWLKDSSRGMLQFLETFVRTGNADWRNYSTPVDLPDMGNRLHVIHAGSRQDDYVKGVQDLHWARLYEERDLGAFLERVRDEWKSAFDFILVDSRTGITDIGGICTVQLPDILICALVANQQNLDGIVEISNRALKARSRLPYDRGLLLILPLVCRFDARDEYAAGQKWLGQLAESLAPLYHSWINDKVTPRDLIDRTTIPYFSIWSFGERLPVATESSANPEYVSYRIETIAALIGHSLARTDLLVESRDSYVAAARRAAQRGFRYDVFVSATEEARDLVAQLVTALNRRGITTFQVFAGNPVEAKRALSESQHFAIVLGPKSEASREELEQFLKQAIEDRSERTLIPLLLTGVSMDKIPALLRHYAATVLSASTVNEVADRIATIVTPEKAFVTSEKPIAPNTPKELGPKAEYPRRRRPWWWVFLKWVFDMMDAATSAARRWVFWKTAAAASVASGIGFGLTTLLPTDRLQFKALLDFSLSTPSLSITAKLLILTVATYTYARLAYGFADIVWVTPLYKEQFFASVINFIFLSAIFLATWGGGGGMIIAAGIFAALVARILYSLMGKSSWNG